ncbi:MAG: tetratricopeptide repeat protein [Planctomycetota bacterium]
MTRGRCVLSLAPVFAALALFTCCPNISLASQQADPANRTYDAASGLLQRGLYDLALSEYDAFLEAQPEHELAPAARYGRAVCLVRLNRHDEALGDLDRLAERDDFEFAAEVAYLQGHAHVRGGRHAEAAARFGELIEQYPDHPTAPEARALRVEALFRAGSMAAASASLPEQATTPRAVFFAAMADLALERFEPAAERFAQVLTSDASADLADRAALLRAQSLDRAGKTQAAADAYRASIAREGAFTAPARVGLGELLERIGDAAGAVEALGPVRTAEGDLGPRASLALGRLALRAGDPAAAAEDFERAQRAEPFADEACLWRAKALLAGGDADSAAQTLRLGLRRDPSQNGVHRPEMTYDLGVALSRAGETEEAVRVFERFPRRFPDHALMRDAQYALALVHHAAGAYDEAESAIERLLPVEETGADAATPAPADIRFLAAENAFLLNDLATAQVRLRDFMESHGDDPRVPVASFRLGIALHRSGNSDEAQPLLLSAAALADEDPDAAAAMTPAFTALAEIAWSREDWSAAASWYDRAAASANSADPAGALLRSGVALARAGDHDEAAERYRASIDLEPEGPHAAHARLELGRSLLRLDNLDEAEASLERVTTDDRYAAHAWRLLAELAERRGDDTLASERLARASDAASPAMLATTERERGHALLRSGDPEAAAGAFASAALASESAEDRTAARAWRAIALGRAGRANDALLAIDELDEAHGESLPTATAHALAYERARALAAVGRADEAQRAYADLAADRASGATGAHAALELADLRVADGDHEGALRALDRVMTDTQTPAALLERAAYRAGVSARTLGEHARAAEAFEVFARETTTNDAALLASAAWQHGDVLSQMGQHGEASERFGYAADTATDDEAIAASLLRLGDAHAARSSWRDSERAFARFIERFPDHPLAVQAHFGLGWALEHRGETENAIAAYERAAAAGAGPTSARAQFQIGECLYAAGAYDDAIRAFLRTDILFAHPEWAAAALYEAGRCFEETGRPSEARAQYEAVADRFGETEWADLAAGRLGALTTVIP